jgi:hypothetical protein
VETSENELDRDHDQYQREQDAHRSCWDTVRQVAADDDARQGAVAELVGIEGGVVSGVINLESSGVEASDRRPRHDEHYHEV